MPSSSNGNGNGNDNANNTNGSTDRDRDLEAGHTNKSNDNNGPKRKSPFKYGRNFKDIAALAVRNDFHHQLKQQLKDGSEGYKFEKYRKSVSDIKDIKNKKIRNFYEAQNERLNDWLEVDMLVNSMADDVLDSMNTQDTDGDGIAEVGGKLRSSGGDIAPLLPDDEREKRRQGERRAKWAININVIANVLLLVAKGVAATQSSSLSLIASLVDSALDLLCTMIIFTTNKLVSRRITKLALKFPVGRRRLEPLGILVFSIIMVVSFLQILQESVGKLLPGAEHKAASLGAMAIGALAATVGVKGLIWIGCARIKTTQVQALAQDCKTDVIFNTLSLLFPLIGHATGTWWLDPVGAALLSLFIIYDWVETAMDNVARLTGAAVDDRVLKKVMFMAWRFAPAVEAYKSLTAYHAGDGVWVELDLLMDENTKVGRAHDISETLQYCLEGLQEVDRAFVSVDYTSQGPTGHTE